MTKKNIKGMRDNRWYLNIMSPNTKGENLRGLILHQFISILMLL